MTLARAIGAIFTKDFITAVSYRFGFISSVLAGFWGLVTFHFLSRLVNTGQFASDPASYFQFAVVGVLFASILEPSAVGTAAAARSEQVQGTLEYLASVPVRRLYIGLSWSAYSLVQSLVVAVCVMALATLIGFSVASVNVAVVVAVVVLTIVVFSAIGNLGAALVILFQQAIPMVAAALSLIAIISGTMFPVSVFPDWLQFIAHLSPLTYALDALRSALISNQPSTSYAVDLAVLLGYAVVLIPVSAFVLEHSFRRAQKRGTLSTF